MSRPPRRKPLLSDPGPPLSPLPPAPQPLPGAWKAVLPLLLLVYLVLAGLHASWVPVGQTGYQNAPDEAAHVRYVQSLVSGHLPTQASATLDKSGQAYEWHQPPLYYVWTRLFVPLGGQGMRVASIMLGLVCILLVYSTARLMFPDEPILAVVAAGVAALLPSHIAITSTINNDVLLEAWFSACLWLLAQSLLRGFSLWRAGWLGILLGLALLTKVTALLLLPVTLLALALLWRGGEPAANLARNLLWALTLMLVISGWWLVRNQQLYGELLPLKTFNQAFGGTAQASAFIAHIGTFEYVKAVSLRSFLSFWAVYGNKDSARIGDQLFLPIQIYILPLLVCISALGGLIRLHFVRKTVFTEAQQKFIQLLMATLILVGASFALFLSKYFQAQGRYLYPAMLPICLLLAMGWQACFPPKYKGHAGAALLAILAVLALLFMTSVQATV